MPPRSGPTPQSQNQADVDFTPFARSPAELLESWRQAEAECGCALDAWNAASKGGKADAYDAYLVALELEALAADALAQSLAESPDPDLQGALAAP